MHIIARFNNRVYYMLCFGVRGTLLKNMNIFQSDCLFYHFGIICTAFDYSHCRKLVYRINEIVRCSCFVFMLFCFSFCSTSIPFYSVDMCHYQSILVPMVTFVCIVLLDVYLCFTLIERPEVTFCIILCTL